MLRYENLVMSRVDLGRMLGLGRDIKNIIILALLKKKNPDPLSSPLPLCNSHLSPLRNPNNLTPKLVESPAQAVEKVRVDGEVPEVGNSGGGAGGSDGVGALALRGVVGL